MECMITERKKLSEESEIKRDGAKAQKNSGRGKIQKGDAIIDDMFLVDYKEYARSYGVSIETWGKICTDAQRSGNLEPTLKLVLGTGMKKVRLFVIRESLFNEMKQAWLEKQSVI